MRRCMRYSGADMDFYKTAIHTDVPETISRQGWGCKLLLTPFAHGTGRGGCTRCYRSYSYPATGNARQPDPTQSRAPYPRSGGYLRNKTTRLAIKTKTHYVATAKHDYSMPRGICLVRGRYIKKHGDNQHEYT